MSERGEDQRRIRGRNLRTGLILAAIALTFFFAFIVRRYFQ